MDNLEILDVTDRISKLTALIKKYQDSYYNGESEISDQEFDTLWNNLASLDPNNPILHTVGMDSGSAFKKCEHIIHMFSQNKAEDHFAFRKWAKDHKENSGYIVQNKCDGSSIELQYEKGIFIKAVTRGNGYVGDDVTCNIIKAKGYPKELKDKSFSGAIRGEVLVFHDTFNKYLKDSKNCRNAANGIMKRKDSENANLLNIVVYDAYNKNKVFKTEMGKIQWLIDNGFDVVDTKIINDVEDIIKYRDEISISRFTDIPYDIDGIVVKCNNVDFSDIKRDRPLKQIAFKFSLDEQPTIVRNVEWSVSGKTRTPVAICDPVYLCGTTVKRANLVNIGLINTMNLKIGSKVMMVKRGEIIPKIERVLFTPIDAINIEFPKVCEYCGSKLVSSETQLYCPNKKCSNTLIHRLIKFCSVNKIYGIGEKVAELLYKSGIKSIKDLYTCSEKDFCKCLNSDKLGQKIYPLIQKTKKEMNVCKFIAGYDMDGIGEKTVKSICEVLEPNSLNDLLSLREDDLKNHSGFSDISSKNIYDQFRENKEDLLELSKIINVKMNNKSKNAEGMVPWLADKNIAITGNLNSMTREEAKAAIESVNGNFVTSVSKNTDFLVTNDPNGTSSKLVSARKNGVDIIDENTFLNLLKGRY